MKKAGKLLTGDQRIPVGWPRETECAATSLSSRLLKIREGDTNSGWTLFRGFRTPEKEYKGGLPPTPGVPPRHLTKQDREADADIQGG